MLNCFRQLYEINTSKLIILNDNNFVVTKFKRKGTYVLQTWHACGAIKKFGNQLTTRQYPVKNYDVVLANSSYWTQAYSEAFGVKQEQIAITGMPRVDVLKMCIRDSFIVDEALSVGDKGFAQKCMKRMQKLRDEEGKTIFFISHALSQVKSFCHTGMWIEGGELKELGDIDTVCEHYSAYVDAYNALSEKEKQQQRDTKFAKRIIKVKK